MRIAIFVFAICGAGALCIIGLLGSKRNGISVTPLNHSGLIEVQPNQKAQFAFQIHNTSGREIEGLHLDVSCNCQMLKQPSSRLPPNKMTECTFWIRAPEAGELQSRIAIRDKDGRQLATIMPGVRVKNDPPALLGLSHEYLLVCVSGSTESKSLRFDTTERREETPWIKGIELLPPEFLKLENIRVEERPHFDHRLCNRTYIFDLKNDMPVGLHNGHFRLVASQGSREPMKEHSVLHLRVLDGISLLPNPLRIQTDTTGMDRNYTVVAVQRTAEVQQITIGEYDSDMFDVRLASDKPDRTMKFEITTKRLLGKTNSQITFRTEKGDRLNLTVNVLNR